MLCFSNEARSNFQGLETVDIHAEQSSPIADTEAAAKVKHPDEDKDVLLDAGSQAKIAKKSRKKRKIKHQGITCSLKPTPRPTKLNKPLMKKILLRRKMILIPNRVRNLLNPAPRPQCHTFLARNRVKPTNQPLYSREPVPGVASSLLRVRHRSSGGSNLQSRVRRAKVNSRTSNGTDEAVSVCHALYSKDPKYYAIPTVTDTYIPQDNAVSLNRSNTTTVTNAVFLCFDLLGIQSQYIQTERLSCGEMMNMSTMLPTEEETRRLLDDKLQIMVIEWDLYIIRLKKSAPVPDAELEEMRIRRQALRNVIADIFSLTQSSSTGVQRRQLTLLNRRVWNDYGDIYDNYTEEADEAHSDSQDLKIADTFQDKQPPTIADTEAAAKVKHPDDEDKDEFLDAGSQAKIPRMSRKKRKKRHQACSLKPTPRPTKLNKSLAMKILLRRKMILIPNRVRNLLDPAPRPQCHTILARNRVKPTNKPVYSRRQPVLGGASSLLRVRNRSSGCSNLQSRVRQAKVNSRSSNRTDEAVSECHALHTEDPEYYAIPTVTDTYILQDNAVRWLYHRPIT